ncbi:hypothetical protein VNO78_06386 [Psophocarpus tetragonolobus]|uniref:Uncharacterized protein n=1 Tax=Psophocarpus tetragonolobus TaxID=3891 RepID=A0AAN9XR33_PSOTE
MVLEKEVVLMEKEVGCRNGTRSSCSKTVRFETTVIVLSFFSNVPWLYLATKTIHVDSTLPVSLLIVFALLRTRGLSKLSEKVDSFNHLKGSNTVDQMMESGAINQPEPQKQMWCEKKQASVNEEIKRMNQLPANSAYVSHRLKVLNKILQLVSVQRTVSQEQELELLFAGLSL